MLRVCYATETLRLYHGAYTVIRTVTLRKSNKIAKIRIRNVEMSAKGLATRKKFAIGHRYSLNIYWQLMHNSKQTSRAEKQKKGS